MEQRIKLKRETSNDKLPEGDNPLLKSLTKRFSKLDYFMSKPMSKKSESKEINLLTEEEM